MSERREDTFEAPAEPQKVEPKGTISQNIQAWRNAIKNEPPGGPTGIEIGKAGLAAMFGGLGSAEWKEFMQRFSANDKQFKRLCGEDAPFMANKYGPILLAYVVAATPCMSGTELKLATEDLAPAMKDILDKGV